MAKVQTLKASVLVTIIVTTIVILLLLNRIEVCKAGNRFPIICAPFSHDKWNSNIQSQLPQTSTVSESKPKLKELYVNTSHRANDTQPRESYTSFTKMNGKGALQNAQFSSKINNMKGSIATNQQGNSGSISTHAEETLMTTESSVEHVDQHSTMTTPTPVNSVLHYKDTTTLEPVTKATVDGVTMETVTEHPLSDLPFKDSSTGTIKSSTTLVDTATTYAPFRYPDDNQNSIVTDTVMRMKEAVTTHSSGDITTRSITTATVTEITQTPATYVEKKSVVMSTTLTKDTTTIAPPIDETDFGPSFNESFIDLLPRSVYFDSRPRDGHNNATVILVQVLKTVFEEKRVVGCGVDDSFTKDFHFYPLGLFTPYVHKRKPSLTHDQAMLTCYDLPVHQGSRAFVFYKDNRTDAVLRLEAEKRLYIPAERREVPGNRWNSSLLVCTTAYGTPPWLREWLVYQKTIGVDFIHLYAQESFIAEGGANNSVLQSYLESGYAKLDVWKAYLDGSQDFYHQQPLLYVDCIYRYRTEFDYVLLYDFDDFFVPEIPGETDIHYYANRFFSLDEKIAAVPFLWIAYFPECGLTKKPEEIVDGNVTNHLAYHARYVRYLKSMYRLSGIIEVQIHVDISLYPGYKRHAPVPYTDYYNWTFTSVSPEIAYVAHIRKKGYPVGKAREECDRIKKMSVA